MSTPTEAESADNKLLISALRFSTNWGRASTLLVNYLNTLATQKPTDLPPGDVMDSIRSSVVFLHAAFEDFLRGIARFRIPTRGDKILKMIPLSGKRRDGRGSEPFDLGDLSRFRGQTVEEVILRSVDEWLERETYNSSTDVVRLLHKLDISEEPYRPLLSHVDWIMKRRHRVVHNADMENSEATMPTSWSRDDVGRLAVAAFAVRLFVEIAIDFLATKGFPPAPDARESAKTIAIQIGLEFPPDQFPNA